MMKKERNSFGDIPISVISATLENVEDAKNIVFIHMSWGGAWAFDLYIKHFTQRGYNCHALDLRGHGDSGGTVNGTTMQDYVDDVRTAVEYLKLDNPIVVGHSMGGLIALMYSAQFESSATISLDGSSSLEVQQSSEEKIYPESYTPQSAGMPKNPIKAMLALKDIYPWRLMKMKGMLKVESGVARSERKKGISIPKEKLPQPLLFIGAEKGTSLPFGIGIEQAKKQAEYYGSKVIEIKGATHPGLLIGRHWEDSAEAIIKWLNANNL